MSLYVKRIPINPLLKWSVLTKETMKNHRPISNFPLLFKLIDKIVTRHIANQLEHNDTPWQLSVCLSLTKDPWLFFYDWFICKLWCNRSTNTTEAFRIFLWPSVWSKFAYIIECVSDADKTSPGVGLHFHVQQGPILGTRNYWFRQNKLWHYLTGNINYH